MNNYPLMYNMMDKRRDRAEDPKTVIRYAEDDVLTVMRAIERERNERGISMRALSTAAGLRPTSYWGIVRSDEHMKAVKALTLAQIENALQHYPF